MISALAAALIGAGGSVVGGIVVGWFTVMAARAQWKRDRADTRAERSRQAAMSIAESVASMEETLVAWSAGQNDLVALRSAFNAFSRTAAVQSIALTESTLRQRSVGTSSCSRGSPPSRRPLPAAWAPSSRRPAGTPMP